jgi:hypothetical protein
MTLMLMRQIVRMPPRIPVSFARSFCILAPSNDELLPPPNALVSPVSFESWRRMRIMRRSATKNATTAKTYQTASMNVHPKRLISSILAPSGTAGS